MPDYKKKLREAITGDYAKKGIDINNFPSYNMKTDTIIQGKSRNHGMAQTKNIYNKNMAGLSFHKGATSGRSSGSRAFPIDQRTTQSQSTGNYKIQTVYNKDALKKSVTPTNFKSKDEVAAKKMFNK
tara:strand:+ start:333 stop:713 length:381 start_codon:yes stop_codon:yes gene_type:complete